MATIIVTGSAGLIGSETVRYFAERGFSIAGVDNDLRAHFFGADASTRWNRDVLLERFPQHYEHHGIDVRNRAAIERLFAERAGDIAMVVHTAAQPSHDWAAQDPEMDFTVNANGTLVMLEATRRYAPDVPFIFTSTNKVYGDLPNELPLVELERRWEVAEDHPFHIGIDETMSIDRSKHSVFGASKVAADVMVQEYGRYFGMKTATFRGGCLTGPSHSGARLHGFLAYLMACTIKGMPYTIYGYKGKQVRDNIHSFDMIRAFDEFFKAPRSAEVYNMGGSRFSNCSMLEAIDLCEKITGRKLDYAYSDDNRSGDHIWYISDVRRFQAHYPAWGYRYGLEDILVEMYEAQLSRSG